MIMVSGKWDEVLKWTQADFLNGVTPVLENYYFFLVQCSAVLPQLGTSFVVCSVVVCWVMFIHPVAHR